MKEPGWPLRFALMSFLAFAVSTPALAATMEEARKAEYEGRWDDALALWKGLESGPDPRAGTEGRLRLLLALGRYEDLDREAAAASRSDPRWDDAGIFHARALEAQGQVQEAADLLRAYVGSHPAAAERARLLRSLGQGTEASAIHQKLRDAYVPGSGHDATDLFAFAEAKRALGDFQGAADLFELAYRDSLDYLDARIALALLFQEKYQAELAADEITEAAKLAPVHPDVLLARTELLILNNQHRNAEASARAVLEIREDPGARRVLARLDLIANDPPGALTELERVFERRPRDLPARYLEAAAHYLQGDSAAYRETLERIEAIQPGDVGVYLEMGDLLEIARRNEEAFAMYRRVLAVEPANPRALIDMGLLQMREGNEKEARGLLEKGFEGDPFNIRAYNQLELLDKMDTFASYPTEHFEIRLEAAEDSLLVPLLARSLEAIHADLSKLHGAAPRNRTIVEVFPNHNWFSARVTGLPWIGGIPAVCFGDVVAMDSPRTLSGGSNWHQILRHEFGHVVALDMTNKKVPFWFTEGLSVYLEQFPRGLSWDQNLKAALLDGEIVPVDSLTIAFTRPKHMNQRLLAYHEAGLIVEDLVDRKGWDVVPALLRAFGEGVELSEAIEKEADESYRAFQEAAMRKVHRTAEALPVWPRPDDARLNRLRAMETVSGEDPEYLDLLALTELQLGMPDAALLTATKLLDQEPDHARGNLVFGMAALAQERTEDARKHIERAVDLGSRDLPAFHTLGTLAEAARDTAMALEWFARALEVYPNHDASRARRAYLLAATGDTAAARAEYWKLLETTDTAGYGALELARLELEQGDGAAAARALDYAVTILPVSADVEGLRGQAYLVQDRDDEAWMLFQRARKLDLKSVETMVGLASYYLKREDVEEALYFAEMALKYDPSHRKALAVLETAKAW